MCSVCVLCAVLTGITRYARAPVAPCRHAQGVPVPLPADAEGGASAVFQTGQHSGDGCVAAQRSPSQCASLTVTVHLLLDIHAQ